MATTLTDIADLAVHPRFIRLVQAAITKAAVAVGNEAIDDTPRSLHRHSLAQRVLDGSDDDAQARRFAWALAADSAITLSSSDGDLEWTVASVWDAIAGAGPET